MNNNSYVFYQGNIVNESEVSISIRSKAFNYGLACFEGIRAYWDEEANQLYAFRLREHYERLLQSCKALYINIPYTVEELCDATIQLLKKNQFKGTTYIRPVAYKGSDSLGPSIDDNDNRIIIYCRPLGSYTGKDELRVKTSSWTRLSNNVLPPRTKATAAYLNSALANFEAVKNGYDEALFLTSNGNICEGPGENIFMIRKGKLITPTIADDILEGITRDTVITFAKNELNIEVEERSISRAEIYAADELFFCGTAMEVTPIKEVDDRLVGDGSHEITDKIRSYFFNATIGKNEKYAHFCTPVY